jgi:sulfur carrier protein
MVIKRKISGLWLYVPHEPPQIRSGGVSSGSSVAASVLPLRRAYMLELTNDQRPKFYPIRGNFEIMRLIINGQPQYFPISPQVGSRKQDQDDAVLNITQLLEHMVLQGKRIAVERNGEIVPRSKFDEQVLIDGDQLEIVVAVGGG